MSILSDEVRTRYRKDSEELRRLNTRQLPMIGGVIGLGLGGKIAYDSKGSTLKNRALILAGLGTTGAALGYARAKIENGMSHVIDHAVG